MSLEDKLATNLKELFDIVSFSYVVAKNKNANTALAKAETVLKEYNDNKLDLKVK